MRISKEYKLTALGQIPVEWDFRKIESDIDLLTGFPFPSNKYSKKGIRLLRGSNVKRNVTDWSVEITQFWKCITSDISQYELEAGDIVVAMDGSLVGRSFAQLSHKDLPALLLQRVARIRSRVIHIGYLKEFICSEYFTKHCDKVKTSSAIPHISPVDIRSFSIPIPPTIEEQTAIATALSDTDALISGLEKLIAKKRAIKQGAMQELLKPKKGYKLKTYGELFEFLVTANYSRAELGSNGRVGYIHYGDIHTQWDDYLDLSQFSLPTISADQQKRCSLVKEGDIVMADASEDYEGVGKSVEIRNVQSNRLIAGLHTFLLRDKDDTFVNGFKAYIRHYPFVKEQFSRLATGMKVYSISKANLSIIQIPIPDKEEQLRIVGILNSMESEISTLESKLSKYRQIKSGMMQTLLTGKIRLL